MTNHPNRAGEYELTFWGGVSVRYRSRHKTLDAAKAEAERVLNGSSNRGAHPAVIYKDGERQPVASVF